MPAPAKRSDAAPAMRKWRVRYASGAVVIVSATDIEGAKARAKQISPRLEPQDVVTVDSTRSDASERQIDESEARRLSASRTGSVWSTGEVSYKKWWTHAVAGRSDAGLRPGDNEHFERMANEAQEKATNLRASGDEYGAKLAEQSAQKFRRMFK